VYNGTVHQLPIDPNKAYDSVRTVTDNISGDGGDGSGGGAGGRR
jgi:hypothetical protein